MGIPVKWQKSVLPARKGKPRTNKKSALCFDATSRYEIVVRGRKILGISQYRRADAILVQGTLLLRKPEALYRALFGERISTEAFSSIEDVHGTTVDFARVGHLLSKEIKGTYEIPLRDGTLSSRESEEAAQLTEQYRALNWIKNGA
jgi:lipoate-protein ligase A